MRGKWPGEMGDVDYGFVGSGNGKVNLYKGQELKVRHIPYENAVHELELLIRQNNDWKDPEHSKQRRVYSLKFKV